MAKPDKSSKVANAVKSAKSTKPKKAAQAQAAISPVATPVAASDEPVVMKLDELTVLKLGKLSAQLRAAASEIAMQSAQKNALLKQIDPQNKLEVFDKKILSLHSEYSAAKHDYITVAGQVKARMGIDLKDYTYDEQTGVLHIASDSAKQGT